METTHDAPRPHIAPNRTCGTCTVCCKVLEIKAPTLFKPAGVICTNCTGTGCRIFGTTDRPIQCREFYCLWRQVSTMPDDVRPDRIGVMFTIESADPPQNPFERRFVIGRSLETLADFEHPGAQAVIRTFIERGNLPIWLSHNKERRLLHPSPALRDAILGLTPVLPSLSADVGLWRQRLGLTVTSP